MNPGNEKENGNPRGVSGVRLEIAYGGLPTSNDGWKLLDHDTESPYLHVVNNNEPVTVAYRARWMSRNLKPGPPGEGAQCTVSV